MNTKTLSNQEFHHDIEGAQRAAKSGPVFITESGHPELVLLSMDEYARISNSKPSIGDLLSSREAAAIEFDPPRMDFRPQPVAFD